MSGEIKFTSFDVDTEVQVRIDGLWGNGAVKIDPKSFNVSLTNPNYGTAVEEELTDQVLDTATVQNPLTTPITETLTATSAYQATALATLTNAVTIGGSTSVPVAIPDIGNVNFGVTASSTDSDSKQTSKQVNQAFSASESLQIQPGTKVVASLKITPVRSTIPFTALVKINAIIRKPGLTPLGIGAKSVGIGTLFTNAPNSQVQVVDANTITVQVSGQIVGVFGTNRQLLPTVSPLAPTTSSQAEAPAGDATVATGQAL